MTTSDDSTRWPFLTGGGKMAALIAAYPWKDTALGPLDGWSAQVRATTALMLRSAVPMVALWGEQGTMIYNDAYAVFAAGRHPELLGSPVRVGWPEVASFNDHVMRVVLAGGTLAYHDQEMTLLRHGRPEQVWMELDYSPLLDESGRPAGVLAIVVETSSKVRAERRLATEGQRLRAMFEQAPGLMAMYRGPRHVIEYLNPACRRVVGDRDVIGREIREAFPELEGQGHFELLDQVYRTGETFLGAGMEVAVQRQVDGPLETLYIDFVYQPLRAEDESVVGIFAQGTDVTQRMRAEQAVRASEARFRTFAEAMPLHVWAADATGAVEWVNDKMCESMGASLQQLQGQGWHQYVHPDDLPQVRQRWAAALAAGDAFESEARLRRHDGRYRWHLTRALPLRDGRGAIIRWIGSNTDVEENKRTVEALARLNETLEERVAQRTAQRDRMWRLSTDVMVVADLQGALLSLNPAWTQLLGWEERESLGRPLIDFVHPDDRAGTLAELGKLGRGEHTLRFDNRYRRRDGSYCVLSWTAVPDDEHIHAVGRDVTADRQAEERLRESQNMLQQAQKMEAVGQLTGGVAHDFNNLLQVIGGNLQLLEKVVGSDQRAARHISTAMSGVARGAKLACQLLAFARRQPLEPRVLNIGSLLTGMEDMLRRSLGDSVELEVVVSGGLWNTLVDPVQVENAILNLAINARDAMDGVGKLTLELCNSMLDDAYAAAHAEVPPGQYVMLAVSDTGCGMTPEVAAKAFEPFFSTKRIGKGTGLGLSMVYGFVKQSGGHLKIYSEVGHGTTVKVYLPRSWQLEERRQPQLPARPIAGGNETILVAEDDNEVRTTVASMLETLGYRVLTAGDAASALALLETGAKVDLLFTDVVMPGPLRSTDLARRARELLPNLSVLYTSGYTENAIVHGGRLDPGVDLLGKPYTQETLARKLRHVLSNQQQRRLTVAPFQPAPASGAGQRVVLVGDDEALRTSTAELLRSLGHEVREAASAQEALEILRSCAVDVLMTDLGLPDINGEVLACRAREVQPGIGIVVAADAAAPVQGGALLRKPYDGPSLARVLAQAAAGGW